MNLPTHRDESEFSNLEWHDQERALLAERQDSGHHEDDDRTLEYRRIAQALREPLPDPLPRDFAERVARRVVAPHANAREDFDRALVSVLWLTLLVSGIVYAARSVGSWWQTVAEWMPAHGLTSPWLFTLLACTGLTALLARLPHSGHRTRLEATPSQAHAAPRPRP